MAKKTEQSSNSLLVVPEAFLIGEQQINKEILLASKEADTKLVINGIGDKENYDKAVKLKASYRTTRTTLEKVRKEISKPYQDFVSDLKKKTDALGAICEEAEDYFAGIIAPIDAEKERIKEEKALAAQRALQARINELFVLGAKVSGDRYFFDYDSSLIINSLQLKEFNDEEFGDFLEDVKTAFAENEHRKAEEARLAEEAERLRIEEQERLKAEQQAEARRLQEDREIQLAKEEELLKKRYALRVKELKMLGYILQPNGIDFIKEGIKQHIPTTIWVENLSEEQWEAEIKFLESYTEPAPEDELPVFQNPMTFDEVIPNIEFEDPEDERVFIRELRFDMDNSHIELSVSAKHVVRIFPMELRNNAITYQKIINEGVVLQNHGLFWAVLTK